MQGTRRLLLSASGGEDSLRYSQPSPGFEDGVKLGVQDRVRLRNGIKGGS